MWDDAKYWLPLVLAGEHVDVLITFADDCATVARTEPDLMAGSAGQLTAGGPARRRGRARQSGGLVAASLAVGEPAPVRLSPAQAAPDRRMELQFTELRRRDHPSLFS